MEQMSIFTTGDSNAAAKAAGHEIYEFVNGPADSPVCHYGYRHADGDIYCAAEPTLAACRAGRDEWLKRKGVGS